LVFLWRAKLLSMINPRTGGIPVPRGPDHFLNFSYPI